MKRACVLFLLLSVNLLFSNEQQNSAISIYLCSRLTQAAKEWNNVVTQELTKDFSIFRPQDIDLSHLPSQEIDSCAFHEDYLGMKKSDLLLVLPPYGRDCAWEVGWFCGRGKPAIAYAETPEEWLKDAMVKGGLTAIFTNNPTLYKMLLDDPSTQSKSFLLSSRKDLGAAIKRLLHPDKIK